MKTSKFFGSANFASVNNATTAHDDFDWDDVEGQNAYANNPMHELMKSNINMPIKHPQLRDLLSGTIVGKGRKEYFVSIPGVSSDAMLPFNETDRELTIGDAVGVYVNGLVLKSDEPIIVSQKRATAWNELHEAQEEGAFIEVDVKDILTRGARLQGLKVYYNGIEGFIPRSQFSRELIPAEAVGNKLNVKIIKADHKGSYGGALVVSDKAVANQVIDTVIEQFEVGDTISGVITKFVTEHNNPNREIGALVSIADGKFTAFMHASETSEQGKPSASLSEGQEIEVAIISINKSKREIKVSQRANQVKGLVVDQVIPATVLRFKEKIGFFVSIGNGFTALLPCSQVADGRNVNIKPFFKIGEIIDVVLTELNTDKNRAIVSYKQATLRGLEAGVEYSGIVNRIISDTGLYVVVNGVGGLLHFSELNRGERLNSFRDGDTIKVSLKGINTSGDRTLVAWARRSRNNN